MLIRVNGLGDYQLLGETRDDAAGEAFTAVGPGCATGPTVCSLGGMSALVLNATTTIDSALNAFPM